MFLGLLILLCSQLKEGDATWSSFQSQPSQNASASSAALELNRDVVWEAMLNQIWSDYTQTVNREKELYGVLVEPLQLSPILGEKIELSRSLAGYQVNLSFWDMWTHGLSGLRLQDVNFKRDPALTKVRTHALLYTPELELEGFYQMDGEGSGAWSWVGASSISSEGAQKFSIKMSKVRITCELHVDLVEGCNRPESAVVTKINFPLEYGRVAFNFDNIGTVLGTVVDVVGRIVIDSQKEALVTIIREGIRRESPGLICDFWKEYISHPLEIHSQLRHQDDEWNEILNRENTDLYRDRLAEQTVEKVFRESILSHLNNVSSLVRKTLDPLPMFPLEFNFHNDVYRAGVTVCDVYLHNMKSIQDMEMILVRDKSLQYSALRVESKLPIAWLSGKYKLSKAYFLGFIPAGAAGDFNVDVKYITTRMIVVLRKTQQDLVLEHFTVDTDWERTSFLFDGLWSLGWGEIADAVMNELGIGGVIVRKQKKYVMEEVKNYLRGMAVCVMWKPSMGIKECMKQFWIDLGWVYPWVYPTC